MSTKNPSGTFLVHLAVIAELNLLAITVYADPSQEYNDLVANGLHDAP